MNNKISVKGKEYFLDRNVGMIDSDGNRIIPKEYDRIIQEDDELFAALVDNPNSGIPIDNVMGKSIIGARSALTISNLPLIWRRDVKKEISAVNIDFYSLTTKFKCNKKVLAYYYSKINKVLVLLDENYTWSIAYIDYENHEIIEDENYANISEIKTLYDGRFLIKHGVVYKVISLQEKVEFELPEDTIDAKDYPKGLVIKNKDGLCSFVDYSGEMILTWGGEKIEPEEGYIKTTHGSLNSIWSYEGKGILLSFLSAVPFKINNQLLFKFSKLIGINGPRLYGLLSIEFGNILPPEYSSLEIGKDGTIIYCKNGNWGLAKYDEENHRVIGIISGNISHMRFNHHGHNQYIIARKGFKYAIYDTEGRQIREFKYRCFIPKKDLYMYDFFDWL